MSMHVTYNHQCPSCQAYYIPYDDRVACPKCGLVKSEQTDFIKEAAASMLYNKAGGSYIPAAWGIGSLGDYILDILFPLFEAHAEESPEDFKVSASGWLGQMNWGDQPYMKDHILGIAIRLHKVLKDDPMNI